VIPVLVFTFFLMASCSTQQAVIITDNDASPTPPADANTLNVTVVNRTYFDVEIIDDTRIIPSNSEKHIALPPHGEGLNDGYRISYRVYLLPDIFITIPRAENMIIKAKQDTAIIESPDFALRTSYFILKNDAKQTISLRKDNASTIYINPAVQFTPEIKRGSPYIEPGNQSIYDELAPGSNRFLIETDQYKSIPFLLDHVAPGFIYEFVFDGANVSLTDARPLRRIGESGWVKSVADANYPLTLVQGVPASTTDNAIVVFASTENSTALYSFDSNGTARESYNREDSSADISVVMETKDERLLVVGYQYDGSTYSPFTQKQSKEGNVQWLLTPSTRQDCSSAYFTAVAQKDADTWLVVGGADIGVNSSEGYRAYIREIRDIGTGVESVWELGPDDFDPRCGAVKAAVYDEQNKVWYVEGELLSENSGTGTYICAIGDGKIIGIDTSLEHFAFKKICVGNNGYYLVGEELKPNGEVYAVLLHYDANGNRIWQQATQLKSYSSYQDALMDSENKQLVLVGTMNASSDSGKGGTPFIQGVDPETGTQLWLQELNDTAFQKADLVYQMIKAPDYGYILSLTGIVDDFYAKPFIVARVNARGRLIK
jgi:hypothetical protein